MKIAAIGDIHSPLFLELFKKSLEKFLAVKSDTAIFLVAGDIVEGGKFEQLDEIADLFDTIDLPIYACYGNNEYTEYEYMFSKKLPKVKFLNDNYVTLTFDKKDYAIIGSRGVLDEPTFWQRKRWPKIDEVYRTRATGLAEIAESCKAYFKILLIHYPPTLKIVEGENPRFLKQMGSDKLNSLIKRFNLVITAHAHQGKKTVMIDDVPVVNVSLPLRSEITTIDLEEKKGLEKFL